MSVKMPVEAIADVTNWAANSDVSWEVDTIKADSWFAEIRLVSDEEADLDCLWEHLGEYNLTEHVVMMASVSQSDYKALIVFHLQGERVRDWEEQEGLEYIPF